MENTDKLRSLFFQEADLFLSVYDKDLNCLDANEAYLKLFNRKREEMVGKNLCEISPDLKANGRYDIYMEVIRTGKPADINHMQPHPYIGNYHFRIRAFKVGDGLGLLVKNVTDLVESVARFNFATRASKEIVYEWDINDNSIWLSDAYYDLIGKENKNTLLTYDDYVKFIHREDLDKLVKRTFETLKKDQQYWFEEYRFIDKNNDVHYFAERSFIINDRNGKPAKKIASVTNISHWKHNINQLENILFDISHKVRQPVCNILGISNLLNDKLINEKDLDRVVGYLKDSVILLDKFTKEVTELVSEYKQKTGDQDWT